MVEVKTDITRQNISAPTGGIPRVSRPNIESGIEKTLAPLFKGLAGVLATSGNEAKANFAFNLQNELNSASLTMNKLELSKLRDKRIAAAGPEGSNILTAEDARMAQKGIKPEFTFHRVRDQATGDILVLDQNKNIIERIKIETPLDRGRFDEASGRIQSGLKYTQATFPRTGDTLKAQLVDPHLDDPVKYKKMMDASLELSGELANIGKVIQRGIDLHLARTGKEVSELDIPNRAAFNRDRLFVALEAYTLQLEAMNRFSQEGLGGPAQIAPISVFNATKGEVMKLLIRPEAQAAYGGLEKIREYFDSLEADIDKSATDAFELGTGRTAAKETGAFKDFYTNRRSIREEGIRSNWSDEFLEATLTADAIGALSSVRKMLIESGQKHSAGYIADVVTNQTMGRRYDDAIKDINSFSTPTPAKPTAIFAAVRIMRDSLLSSTDASRMHRAKKAIEGLLSNKNIDWPKNPSAKEELEQLYEEKFSGTNMSRAEAFVSVFEGMKRVRNK